MPKAQTAERSDVIAVKEPWKKRRYGKWDGRRHNDFRRRGDYVWYNGHRGYREWRRGYRYHDGFWFPAGAFIAGAIIGGAIANNNNYVYQGGGSAHEHWCYDHYRSYRAWDNTFQPYNGPRRQCYSPYN
ncbi:BA14K family protein [Mesorhizobium sp. ZMM04-4]